MQLFEAVARLWESAARTGPLVVVIEDLHWADESTRHLLRFLTGALTDAPVLVIATYRTDELDRRHPLRPVPGRGGTPGRGDPAGDRRSQPSRGGRPAGPPAGPDTERCRRRPGAPAQRGAALLRDRAGHLGVAWLRGHARHPARRAERPGPAPVRSRAGDPAGRRRGRSPGGARAARGDQRPIAGGAGHRSARGGRRRRPDRRRGRLPVPARPAARGRARGHAARAAHPVACPVRRAAGGAARAGHGHGLGRDRPPLGRRARRGQGVPLVADGGRGRVVGALRGAEDVRTRAGAVGPGGRSRAGGGIARVPAGSGRGDRPGRGGDRALARPHQAGADRDARRRPRRRRHPPLDRARPAAVEPDAPREPSSRSGPPPTCSPPTRSRSSGPGC